MGLRARLMLARTLVVVETRHHDAAAFTAGLFAHGADIVVVGDLSASVDAVSTVEAAQRAAMPLNKLVAVAGDLDAARAVMADVLLGGTDLDPALAHARLHEYALVGIPAGSATDLAHLAESRDVDFVLLGSGEVTGRTDPSELELVRAAAHAMPVDDPHGTPWFVPCDLAGEGLGDLVDAGARRVALVVRTEDDLARLGQVADRLRRAWHVDPALEDFAFRVLSDPDPPASLRPPTQRRTW